MRKTNRLLFKFAGVCIVIGAILSIVGFVGGARGNGYMLNNYWEKDTREYEIGNFEQIDALDVDVEAGNFTIQTGDEFKLEHNFKDSYVDMEVEGGTLKIKTDISNLWGFGFWNNNNGSGKIVLTIPKDMEFNDCFISVGAGKATINDINAKNASFSVGAGKLDIYSVKTTESTKFNVGAGELVVKNMDVVNTTVDSGVGKASLQGLMTGYNNVDCGIGQIELFLTGNKEDYYYKVDSGIGNVKINNSSSMGSNSVGDPNAPVQIKISCGIGQVRVVNQ